LQAGRLPLFLIDEQGFDHWSQWFPGLLSYRIVIEKQFHGNGNWQGTITVTISG